VSERGHISVEFALMVGIIAGICIMWIVLNEAVINVHEVALRLAPEQSGLLSAIVSAWRLFPVLVLIGIFAWAFWRAYKREPFYRYAEAD